MKSTTFVVTGPPSSGKSTITKLIGEYAKEKNISFESKKFSTPIAVGIEKSGYRLITKNDANYYTKDDEVVSQRTLMQNYGNKLRESYGPQVLAQMLTEENKVAKQMKNGIYVFEGCRNIHEYEFIKNKCVSENVECVLVGVFASLENCFKRASSNKPAVFSDFQKQYELEMRENVEDDSIQVSILLGIAKAEGVYLENDSSFEELKQVLFEKLEEKF